MNNASKFHGMQNRLKTNVLTKLFPRFILEICEPKQFETARGWNYPELHTRPKLTLYP
jgi:hypothetical protein